MEAVSVALCPLPRWHHALLLVCRESARRRSAPEIYAQLARRGRYAELTFFGDIRYSPKGQRLRKSLDRAAESLFRARLKRPVDVYEGPA